MASNSGESSAVGSSCSPDPFLRHKVSKHDNLAGIAIKYGVSVLDIKQANGLLSDNAMFGVDTLMIPLERKEVRISDANSVAKFVGTLGRRADHSSFVNQPGTIALGPLAKGSSVLAETVKTPTSSASSASDFGEGTWRDVREVEMKVLAETVMPSRKKASFGRDSLRQRCCSSRNSDRPGSCSPRMQHGESYARSATDRPCSCSPTSFMSETSPGESWTHGRVRKRAVRPPNIPNGKRSSQLKGYLVSMAHSLAEQYGNVRRSASARQLTGGGTGETFLQRIKRVANSPALANGSSVRIGGLFSDSLASSFSSFSSREASNVRRWSDPGSPTANGDVLTKAGVKKTE